jgi:pilus assembly protein CpaF
MAFPDDEEKTDPNLRIPVTPPAPPVKMPQMGLLDALMNDSGITEIMVNDTRNIMIERDGRLGISGARIESVDELNRVTRNILDMTGRILSPEQPYVDVMLPDGSRVNIIGPPLTLHGPCLTIRKFPTQSLSLDDLMKNGSLDRKMAYFLNLAVIGKLNILISGGTGSGKSTLLNALIRFIPKQERLIVIEDTPELHLSQPNSVRLQTKPQTPAALPIPARELVANSLRMRPDRIIVGECRRGEAFDMIQAMNTGHEGSMTTLHANSPRDALARLETLSLMGAPELPLSAIKRQIASTIDLIIQLKRMRDGTRRVTQIAELTGMEGETHTLQDLYTFSTQLRDPHRKTTGQFLATGLVPVAAERLREMGYEVPPALFQ